MKAVVLSAVMLALAACDGGAAAAQPSASEASQAPPSARASGASALSPAATITLDDDNRTIQVKVGQVLNVSLKADQGMDNWQVPNPDSTVLAPTVNPAAAAARGVTLRAFKAQAPGTATLTATDRATCNPGQACSQAVRSFHVTVVVSG